MSSYIELTHEQIETIRDDGLASLSLVRINPFEIIQQLCQRLLDAEISRDALADALDENWVTHQQLIASREEADRLRKLIDVPKVSSVYDEMIITKNRPNLPPRDVISSVMMARSHELTDHEGEPCDCEKSDEPK